MPICRCYWTPPKEFNKYGKEQVLLVCILPDGEIGIIMFNRTFVKVPLNDLEWSGWID